MFLIKYKKIRYTCTYPGLFCMDTPWQAGSMFILYLFFFQTPGNHLNNFTSGDYLQSNDLIHDLKYFTHVLKKIVF